jgi:hypothetical protein
MRTATALVLGLLLGFIARAYLTHDTCDGLGVVARKVALGTNDDIVICSKVPLPQPFSLDHEHLAGIVRSSDLPPGPSGAPQPDTPAARASRQVDAE